VREYNLKISIISPNQVPSGKRGMERGEVSLALSGLRQINKVVQIKGIKEQAARSYANMYNRNRNHKKKIHCRVVKSHPQQAFYWLEGTDFNHCFE
jgi:hypothetical protein